jgi:multicomponent Na+:H+ antiporter subunit D
LVLAALEQQAWLMAVVILAGSLIAVIYLWKLVEALFFRAVTQNDNAVKEAPLSLLIPMWALVIANIYFGLNTELTVGVAETAVRILRMAPQ